MEINPDVLLALGFVKVHPHTNQYYYKGIEGYLMPKRGQFYFTGLSQGIDLVADLKFLCSLIDYNP